MLTNQHLQWNFPKAGRVTNNHAFRVHEGRRLPARMEWRDGTAATVTRGREAAIELRGDYTCRWADYSLIPGAKNGSFRYLALSVG